MCTNIVQFCINKMHFRFTKITIFDIYFADFLELFANKFTLNFRFLLQKKFSIIGNMHFGYGNKNYTRLRYIRLRSAKTVMHVNMQCIHNSTSNYYLNSRFLSAYGFIFQHFYRSF